MDRRRAIWIVALLVAALGAAAVVVRASSAAPATSAAIDTTYSCRVASAHVVNLDASVTLPPVKGKAQPGVLALSTGVKVIKNGDTTTVVSQLGVQAVKHGLRIDKSSCHHVKQQIPLKPKGLPGPPTTVTPTLRGYDNEICDSTSRVLFRLRLKMTDQKPSHALLAVRNTGSNHRPIAFYNWSPKKVNLYTSPNCSTP